MIENLFNEDYKKGMKLLLQESKKQGINVRKCQWIPNVSKMLSEHDLCYKFWHNVVKQKYLNRVFLCKDWYDVMYDSAKWLFLWPLSEEGAAFWKTNLWEMLGLDLHDNFFDFPHKLKERKLYQI